MIGATLAHYRILDLLGKGGMGEVYRARDPRLERDVAIKVLPGEFAKDPERRARFEREAKTLAALSHPNAVPIFDYGVQDDVAFAVMELVDGRTLADELRGGPLDARRAIEITLGITRGLGAAHAKGILHRDLKPANVMLTADGQVKILDFGLARRVAKRPDQDTTLIADDDAAGTTAWLAPERLRGEPAEERSDLFALGAMLHEMLEGSHPFARPTAAETATAILRDEPAVPRKAPPGLAALIGELLKKDPALRTGSAQELERRLRTVLEDPEPEAVDSLAVLPFHNEAGDEEIEFLIDGLTDSLIDTLSQLPQLKVLARSTVFARRELHDRPREAGLELGVRAVLAGRLQQRGDDIVVRAELVDAADGSRLWGGRLRRPLGDLFEIEEEICQEITDKLRLELSPTDRARISRRQTGSADARDAYMRGRYVWNRWKNAEAMRTAISFFERALALDPLYAEAWGGLADSYSILGNVKALPPQEAYPKAREAALKGLAIDDQRAELHSALGFVQRYWDWDWEASRASFERAVQLNPGYSTSHRFYAHLLSGLGEHDAAIARAQRALELDPLSLILHTSVGDAYFYARRYDEAMGYYRKCLELDPEFLPAHSDLARALELAGRYDEALAEFELSTKLAGREPTDPSAGLACVYASMGRRDEALQIVQALRILSRTKYVSPYAIASIHACLGDAANALDWLEKAFGEHDQTLVWLKVHPRLDVVREDPRYEALLGKMKL